MTEAHAHLSADIVERLRQLDDGVSRPVSMLEREICGKAADEIERLRDLFRLFGGNEAFKEMERLRALIPDPAQASPELQFCHWLKGYLGAIKGRDELTPHEANTIRGNLNELIAAQPPAAPVSWHDAIMGAAKLHTHDHEMSCRIARDASATMGAAPQSCSADTAELNFDDALTSKIMGAARLHTHDHEMAYNITRDVLAVLSSHLPQGAPK